MTKRPLGVAGDGATRGCDISESMHANRRRISRSSAIFRGFSAKTATGRSWTWPCTRRRSTCSDAGSFFVRSDVARAFDEGLIHGTAPTDASSYFRDVEHGWRTSIGKLGVSKLRILPTTVDGLLKYANDHDRDPKDQQNRADHLPDRIREGAPTLDWPPERNALCWCDSGRKYKKCCGSPTRR